MKVDLTDLEKVDAVVSPDEAPVVTVDAEVLDDDQAEIDAAVVTQDMIDEDEKAASIVNHINTLSPEQLSDFLAKHGGNSPIDADKLKRSKSRRKITAEKKIKRKVKSKMQKKSRRINR